MGSSAKALIRGNDSSARTPSDNSSLGVSTTNAALPSHLAATPNERSQRRPARATTSCERPLSDLAERARPAGRPRPAGRGPPRNAQQRETLPTVGATGPPPGMPADSPPADADRLGEQDLSHEPVNRTGGQTAARLDLTAGQQHDLGITNIGFHAHHPAIPHRSQAVATALRPGLPATVTQWLWGGRCELP